MNIVITGAARGIGKATLASDAGAAVADRRWEVPGANGLAFDPDGNLWYSSSGARNSASPRVALDSHRACTSGGMLCSA